MFSCELVHASMPRKNWVAIGRVAVYFARPAHAFSAGIKCRRSTWFFNLSMKNKYDTIPIVNRIIPPVIQFLAANILSLSMKEES